MYINYKASRWDYKHFIKLRLMYRMPSLVKVVSISAARY